MAGLTLLFRGGADLGYVGHVDDQVNQGPGRDLDCSCQSEILLAKYHFTACDSFVLLCSNFMGPDSLGKQWAGTFIFRIPFFFFGMDVHVRVSFDFDACLARGC